MRAEAKLGMVISVVVVMVAGTYYAYRDGQDAPPIPLNGEMTPVPARPAATADAPTKKTKKVPDRAARGRASAKKPASRGVGAASDKQPTRSGSSPNAKPGSTKPSTRRSEKPNAAGREGRRKSASRSANQGKKGAGKPRSAPLTAQNAPGSTAEKSVAKRRGSKQPGSTKPGAATTGKRTQPAPKRTSSGGEAAPSKRHTSASGAPARKPAVPPPPAAEGKAGSKRPASRRKKVASAAAKPASKRPKTAPTAQADVAVDKHRLQAGDTFSSLAKMYYGSERHTQFLIDANPQIANPGRLSIGTVIHIPAPPKDARASARPADTPRVTKKPAADPPKTETTAARTYRVVAGDTFYGIARDALGDSTRWNELFELNKALVNGDPKQLKVGQIVNLPSQ